MKPLLKQAPFQFVVWLQFVNLCIILVLLLPSENQNNAYRLLSIIGLSWVLFILGNFWKEILKDEDYKIILVSPLIDRILKTILALMYVCMIVVTFTTYKEPLMISLSDILWGYVTLSSPLLIYGIIKRINDYKNTRNTNS